MPAILSVASSSWSSCDNQWKILPYECSALQSLTPLRYLIDFLLSDTFSDPYLTCGFTKVDQSNQKSIKLWVGSTVSFMSTVSFINWNTRVFYSKVDETTFLFAAPIVYG